MTTETNSILTLTKGCPCWNKLQNYEVCDRCNSPANVEDTARMQGCNPACYCYGTGRVDLSEDEWKEKIAGKLHELTRCNYCGEGPSESSPLMQCNHLRGQCDNYEGFHPCVHDNFHVSDFYIDHLNSAMEDRGYLMHRNLVSKPPKSGLEWLFISKQYPINLSHENAYAAALLALEGENHDGN